MRAVRYVASIALFATLCLAEQPRKAPCNASHAGQFWPEEANVDREAAHRLYQQGKLEMCSLAVWKYRWESISVNVRGPGTAKSPVTAKSRNASAAESR